MPGSVLGTGHWAQVSKRNMVPVVSEGNPIKTNYAMCFEGETEEQWD